VGRGLMIVLAASLACNVFLGGFVAGRMIGKPPPGPPRGELEMERIFGASEVLSEEGRKAFRGVFFESRDALRESRRKVREARRSMSESLNTQPWDDEAIDQAIADFHAAQDAHRTVQTALFVEAFKVLSIEDRKALMEHQARKRRPRDGRRRGGRDPR